MGTISDVFSATSQHHRFYSFNQGPPTLSYVVDKILNAKDLQGNQIRNMDRVVNCFNKAIKSNDARHLIHAYTMETSFYEILDRTLATHNELTNEERENPPWFCAYARFLASDEPTLRSYRWTGITYSRIRMFKDNVAQYQLGKMLMNKAFTLTTKSQKSIEKLVSREKAEDKYSTIFKYIVNDDRAALDISTISEFSAEEEVLILPCMDFEITEINNSGEIMKITLSLR
jgi:hypothetical protein